jgi:hypothetical protein
MAKAHRTKAQHYVGQFYLRGFANAKEMMWCYDKKGVRCHPISVKGAAQEPYFYEIPPGTTKEPVPLNDVEDRLSKIEGIAAFQLKDLIKFADQDKIPQELLGEFCSFVAIQWMRTKTHRDNMHEMITKGCQTLVDDLVKLNYPGHEDLTPRFVFGEKTLPAIHAQQMLDPETIWKMGRALERHLLIVGINDTNSFFYTSDHPVVRNPNCCDDIRPFVGPSDPGIEYAFPLDNKHILLILERNHFKELRRFDARAMPMTLDQVKRYNALQVRRSCQRLFCINDDFELAREICKAEPIICDPNRPRVKAGSTPFEKVGDELKNYSYVIALE